MMNELEDRIQNLIEQNDFHELSPAEQEMVLSVMSKSTFDAQRMLVRESKKMFTQESTFFSPDPQSLFKLREVQKTKKKSSAISGLLFAMIDFRLPAYQAGLVAVLPFFIYFGFNKETEPPMDQPPTQIVYEITHDTVEVVHERIVERPVERVVTKLVYRDAPSFVLKNTANLGNGIVPVANVPDLATVEQSFGNSSIEASKLEQFRVVGI